ncbi:MAG: DUF1552 domain-containing protein [Polyangiaceae bacterium]|nr:DUF1552 domain-containing protein [Polyangiaceae bacterium]
MNGQRISRRGMLQALGIGGLAAALLPHGLSLTPGLAQAGPTRIPKRILFVYGMGSIRSFYPPVGIGGKAPTETQWALGPLHGALAGMESKLIITDGIDMSVDGVSQPAAANAHINGGTEAMTGAKRVSGSLAGAISIDQYIARGLNSPSPITKIPSLKLSSACNGGDAEGGPHYIASGQVISPERNPATAFNRVFAGFAPPSQNPADVKAAEAALAQKKSVLQSATKEFSAISTKLAAEDKKKLEAHAAAISDLEARLALRGSGVSCAPPDAAYKADLGKFGGVGAHPLADFDLDARLVTAAFSCDLTRVATIHLPTHYDLESTIGYSGGMFGTSDSHDLTHKTNDSSAALWNDAAAMAMIKKVHTTQAQLFRRTLDLLNAIPESDGGSLLDHTVVLWCSQIAEGGHEVTELPWILAGGAGGAFRTGRYLKFARPGGRGPSHNNLFVSLANAVGVPTTTFGESSVCTGPLAGL